MWHTPISNDLTALSRLSSKVLPTLITSPVAFICVLNLFDARTNLSNGNLAIFVTIQSRVGSKLAGVFASFISSSLIPTAILADTLAIGQPLAFEASADERDTLGFTSIRQYWNECGSKAN